MSLKRWNNNLISELDKIKSRYPNGGRVLDLGAGTGSSKQLFDSNWEWIGVDIYPESDLVLKADAHNLSFSDNYFDLVISIAVFEHLHSPWIAIKEISRVMKEGSFFLGTVAFLEPEHGNSYFHMTKRGISQIFKEGNLKEIIIEPIEGWNVLTNRPAQAAYRAPGAPQAIFAVECVIDELCQELNLDPLSVRQINAAKKGTKASYGPTFEDIGLAATLEAAKNHPHYTAPLGPNQGRGLACGFWFNFGGETCVSLALSEDGTASLSVGTPDIGGSRASMCQIVSEELSIPYEKVRATIADTATLGYNEISHGSRVTFATGLATIKAARDMKKKLCARAAKSWGLEEDAVFWDKGYVKPAGPNAGNHDPVSIVDIAKTMGRSGGPISAV